MADEQEMHLEFDDSPGGASVASVNDCTSVFKLPEYESSTRNAGRSDPGVPRVKIGSVNNTDDLAGAVRKFADEPGAYYAERRIGREVADRQIFIIRPKARTVDLNGPTVTQLDSSADIRPPRKCRYSRRGRRPRVRTPATPAPPQVDPIAMMREMRQQLREEREAVQAEIRSVFAQQPQTPDPMSWVQQNLSLWEILSNAKDKLNPPAYNPDRKIGDRLLDIAEKAAPQLGPMIVRIAQAKYLTQQLPPRAAQPPAPDESPATPLSAAPPSVPVAVPSPAPAMSAPARTPAADEEEATPFDEQFEQWIYNVALDDYRKGAPVIEAAEDFIELLEEFRESEAFKVSSLELLMTTQPPAQIAAHLGMLDAQLAAEMSTPQAIEWLTKLQVEINSRVRMAITGISAITDISTGDDRAA